MPELPEVETVMRGLEKAVTGKKIASVSTSRHRLRVPFPKDISRVAGGKISGFTRRAKYILMHLDQGRTMIIHLGMSGRMTINPEAVEKHDHMTMVMKDGTRIVFNDARRFGLIDLCATEKLDAHRLFKHLGPEPFDKKFDAEYLAQKIKGKKTTIKLAIMDQRVVVGVGNIYAAEALFNAGINPKRAGGSLKKDETEKLVAEIISVLKKAIKAGGSSLRDYVQADGELGYFQHAWAAYGREGEKCKRCKGGKSVILRIMQGARSTFYCPVCQK